MAAGSRAVLQEAGTRREVLVEPRWLEEHLHDPALRLVEVDVSPVAYDRGHIEGAVLWNVYRDLKDTSYRLVDKAATERLIGRSGIAPGSTVVFYGYAPAMGFWLMKLYGHADVRILDCARGTWQDQGRPWTIGAAKPVATRYRLPDEDERIRACHWKVEDAIDSPACIIVDVRTALEFRGGAVLAVRWSRRGGTCRPRSLCCAPADRRYLR